MVFSAGDNLEPDSILLGTRDLAPLNGLSWNFSHGPLHLANRDQGSDPGRRGTQTSASQLDKRMKLFKSQPRMRARRWIGKDRGLSIRMFLVLLFLLVLFIIFMVFLWAIIFYALAAFHLTSLDMVSTAVLALLIVVFFAAVILGIEYFFSDAIFLNAMGARRVTPEEAPELHRILEELAEAADLPKPKLTLIETDLPNAFATGRNPNHSVVGVTSGLLLRVNTQELEGVLAHEISHIKNGDAAIMTLALLFPTSAYLVMNCIRPVVFLYLALYPIYLLIRVISHLLILLLSRYRELMADQGAVIITGSPSQLASALIKIATAVQEDPSAKPMNPFFIIPAGIANLLSTHPSLESRLRGLTQIQGSITPYTYNRWHLFSSPAVEVVRPLYPNDALDLQERSNIDEPVIGPSTPPQLSASDVTRPAEPSGKTPDIPMDDQAGAKTILRAMAVVVEATQFNGLGKVALETDAHVYPAKGEREMLLVFGASVQVISIESDYLVVRRVV